MSIYDSGRPLTAFGHRWRGISLCTPLLVWNLVGLSGMALDALNLSPLESGTSLGTLAAFVASATATTAITAGIGYMTAKNNPTLRRLLAAVSGAAGLVYAAVVGVGLLGAAAVTFALCCVVVAVIAAVIGFVIGRVPSEHHDVRVAYYTGLTGLAAGLFLVYAATAGVHNWLAAIAWSLAVLCGVGLWKPVRSIQIKFESDLREARRTPQPALPPPPRKKTEAEKFADIIAAAGVKGVRVLGDPHKPKILTRSGWGLHIAFPEDDMSVTYQTLKSARPQLERAFGRVVDGGLRTGAIRFARPKNKAGQEVVGGALIYIDVKDILSEVLIAPEPTGRPRSVYDLVHVGTFIDGTPIELPIMWLHVLIGGKTRKGKGTFIDLMLEYLGTCPDAVVWVADGKGASTLAPHMEPYFVGEIDPVTNAPVEPCIDWPAVHRIEVEQQARAFIAAAKARPGIRRRPENAAANAGDKWRASPDFPAIFWVVDEAFVFFGKGVGPSLSNAVEGADSGEMSALLTEAMVLGAGECCFAWIAVQRGTVTMVGNGDAKSQQGGRICLPVQSRSEASEFFESDIEASALAAELDYPGSCVITGFGFESPQKGRFFTVGVDPDDRKRRIYRTAIMRGRLAGVLDEPTAAAIAEFGYDNRLDDDHMYFMYGTPRPAHLLRWQPPGAKAKTGERSNVIPIRTTTRERLGLNDVAAFGDPRPADVGTTRERLGLNDVAAFGDPGPADVELDAHEAARFDQLTAGFDEPQPASADRPQILGITDTHVIMLIGDQRVAVPREDASDVDDKPTAYARFLEIVDEAGEKGITGAEAIRRLGPLAPAARTTIYTWRDRGVRERRIVTPHGEGQHSAPFYSPAGWAAAQGRQEEAA